MRANLRLALGQLDFLVGDIAGNAEKVLSATGHARDALKAHAIVFPELALTGYPPEDLLLREGLNRRVAAQLERLRREVHGIDVIVGHSHRHQGRLYNAVSLVRNGRIEATYFKHCLPNYGVFDELRYFAPGTDPCVVRIQDVAVGITICEDIWERWPIEQSVRAGAQLVVNTNASPYHINKTRERLEIVSECARSNRVPIVYLNLMGGQDELVFDGESCVVDAQGELRFHAPAFREDIFLVQFTGTEPVVPVPGTLTPSLSDEESVYHALVLGVRDYVNKNRFPGVVIGLSGGIDSALVLCIAVDALGAERVQAVMMPSRFTADMSIEDARTLAAALRVRYSTIPIEPMFEAFLGALKEEFRGLPRDTTEENLQARIRGMLLMAISNKTGKMVLTTGNKSEMAVGYATLYGDMAGGFGAIKDVPKTMVYRLAEFRNRSASVIPRRIFERPPSAELAAGQQDTDSLPSYAVLDPILERYVERDEGPEEIIAAGFDPGTVRRVVTMVDRNEYKRRQAPPGVRITPRAFGRDRRYPITSGFGRERP